MKLTFNECGNDVVAEVVLSERNLLALLHKLYMEGSARELQSNDVLALAGDGELGHLAPKQRFSVKVESDQEHYGCREFPPGPMHPETERILKLIQKS